MIDDINNREWQAIHLYCTGSSVAEVARKMGITHTSANTHLWRAKCKLGLYDRHDLYGWYYDVVVPLLQGQYMQEQEDEGS